MIAPLRPILRLDTEGKTIAKNTATSKCLQLINKTVAAGKGGISSTFYFAEDTSSYWDMTFEENASTPAKVQVTFTANGGSYVSSTQFTMDR